MGDIELGSWRVLWGTGSGWWWGLWGREELLLQHPCSLHVLSAPTVISCSVLLPFSSLKPTPSPGQTRKSQMLRRTALSKTKFVGWLHSYLLLDAGPENWAVIKNCYTSRLGLSPLFPLVHGFKWNFPGRFGLGGILLLGLQVIFWSRKIVTICGQSLSTPPMIRPKLRKVIASSQNGHPITVWFSLWQASHKHHRFIDKVYVRIRVLYFY